MGESTGEPAAQGKGNPRSRASSRYSARAQRTGRLTIEIWVGTMEGRHLSSLARPHGGGNEAEVPDFRYSGTPYRKGPKICAATANSTFLLFVCGLRTIVRRASETENGNCSDGTQIV